MDLWGRYFKFGGLRGQAASLFQMSFFAQLGLYPLLAFYFHKISLVSLFSNMLLVPGSAAAMSLGFLLPIFSKAAFVLKLLVPATALFMKLFIGTVRFFAAFPFSSVRVAEPSVLWVAGFYLFAFVFLHAPLIGFKKPRLYLAGALGLAVMAAGVPWRAQAGEREKCLALLFGDSDTRCALVKVPGSGIFIVNPGLKGKKLADAVFAEGSRGVEGIMLTSLGKNNYSGLKELASMVKIKRVLIPYGPQPPGLAGLLRELEGKGISVNRVWPGEEPVADVKIGAAWGGYGEGYTGRNDLVDWSICGLSVQKDGGYAVQDPPGPAPLAAEARKGVVTTLEFPYFGGSAAPGQTKLVSYPL
jgi:hypothetical protein